MSAGLGEHVWVGGTSLHSDTCWCVASDSPAPVAQPLDDPWLDDIIGSLAVGLDAWEDKHRIATQRGAWQFNGPDGPFHGVVQSTVRRLRDYRADAARSVPSDRPASGLTDPDDAAPDWYWYEKGILEGRAQAARSVPDNAALRESIEALRLRRSNVDDIEAMVLVDRIDAVIDRVLALLAAAPASPSGSSPVPAGLDVETAARWLDTLGGMWSWNENGVPDEVQHLWWGQVGRDMERVLGRVAKRPAALASPADPEEAGR